MKIKTTCKSVAKGKKVKYAVYLDGELLGTRTTGRTYNFAKLIVPNWAWKKFQAEKAVKNSAQDSFFHPTTGEAERQQWRDRNAAELANVMAQTQDTQQMYVYGYSGKVPSGSLAAWHFWQGYVQLPAVGSSMEFEAEKFGYFRPVTTN